MYINIDHEIILENVLEDTTFSAIYPSICDAARNTWSKQTFLDATYYKLKDHEAHWDSWAEVRKDSLSFKEQMKKSGLYSDINQEPDSGNYSEMTDNFLDNIGFVHSLAFNGDNKARLLWFILSAYVYCVTITKYTITPEELLSSPEFSEVIELMKTHKTYNSILDEYNDLRGKNIPDSVLKSVEPVDVSIIPEYLLEDLYYYDGCYFRPSEIRKMMTASGSVASALETQDLEGEMENSAEGGSTGLLNAEEHGRNYLKKLKLRRGIHAKAKRVP